jgi:hypothetical protein
MLGVRNERGQLVSEAAASAQHPGALRRPSPGQQLRNGGLQAGLAVPAGEVLGALHHGAQPLLPANSGGGGVLLPGGEQKR